MGTILPSWARPRLVSTFSATLASTFGPARPARFTVSAPFEYPRTSNTSSRARSDLRFTLCTSATSMISVSCSTVTKTRSAGTRASPKRPETAPPVDAQVFLVSVSRCASSCTLALGYFSRSSSTRLRQRAISATYTPQRRCLASSVSTAFQCNPPAEFAPGSGRAADLAEDVQLLQRLAGADHHRREGILGEEHREARLLAEEGIQVLEQRAAAREHDPAVRDVARQLGRGALQRHLHRFDDGVDRLRERVADLVRAHRERARHAGDEIAPLDVHGEHFVARVGVADAHLDQLGGALADQEIVLAFDVLDDRLIHLVPAHADALGVHDAGERDHRDVAGAAADVDDHVPGRLGDGQPRPDRRGHGLLDQVDLARPGALRGLAHGAAFHFGDARRDPDDDARLHQRGAVVRRADEVAQHRGGDLEVGDHSVLHGADGDDVARSAPEHLLRFLAYGKDLLSAPRFLLHGDDRGLVGDDAHPADVDQRVRGAEIDGQVAGEELVNAVEHECLASEGKAGGFNITVRLIRSAHFRSFSPRRRRNFQGIGAAAGGSPRALAEPRIPGRRRSLLPGTRPRRDPIPGASWASSPQVRRMCESCRHGALYCAARPAPEQAICARSSRTLAPCSAPQRFRRGSRASRPSVEPPSRSRKARIRASSKAWTRVSKAAAVAHQIGAPRTKSQAAAVSATAAQRSREKLESTAPENRPPWSRVSATEKIDLVAKRVARPPPNQRARANFSKISPIHGCVTRSTRHNLDLAPPP